MGLKIKIIALILGLVFFFFIARYSKKNAFKPSFTFLWFLIATFLISIPLAEDLYRWIAYSLIGIVDARHIIYIVLIGFLLIYVFYSTIKISRLTDQVLELISYTAILDIKEKKTAMKLEQYIEDNNQDIANYEE